jgi:hypothetical protein
MLNLYYITGLETSTHFLSVINFKFTESSVLIRQDSTVFTFPLHLSNYVLG